MATIADIDSGAPSLAARGAVWLATGLGIGLVTPLPGTIAGAWGLLLVPAVLALPTVQLQAGAILLLAIVAIFVCDAAQQALGGLSDPGAIVLDEIVALPIVFLGGPAPTLAVLATGYLLFRLFDAVKPWPIPYAERLPGGLGIVADDLIAAAAAWLALRGILWLDAAASLHWLTPV